MKGVLKISHLYFVTQLNLLNKLLVFYLACLMSVLRQAMRNTRQSTTLSSYLLKSRNVVHLANKKTIKLEVFTWIWLRKSTRISRTGQSGYQLRILQRIPSFKRLIYIHLKLK
jgi:hypothetical protein